MSKLLQVWLALLLGIFIAIMTIGLITSTGQPKQEGVAAYVDCQEITIHTTDHGNDSHIWRCDMPDGALCYLYGTYGSISCLDPSLMSSNLR